MRIMTKKEENDTGNDEIIEGRALAFRQLAIDIASCPRAMIETQELVSKLIFLAGPFLSQILQILYAEVSPENLVQSGDHSYAVLHSQGEKRAGTLVAVGKIPANSNPQPDLHEHPLDLMEFTIAAGGGLELLYQLPSQALQVQTLPNGLAHQVPQEALHSVRNTGQKNIYFMDVRAIILSSDGGK